MRFTENNTPGPAFLKAVWASLVLRGSSLSEWARENGVKRQNLTKALLGEWKGPKADALVRRIVRDVSCEAEP